MQMNVNQRCEPCAPTTLDGGVGGGSQFTLGDDQRYSAVGRLGPGASASNDDEEVGNDMPTD